MEIVTNHSERIAIAESCYGRDYGWTVESPDGESLADLVECRTEEMFWDSYRVIPAAAHPETLTVEFWYPDCHRFRNRHFRNYTIDSFGHFDATSSRVTLRSLYLNAIPTLLDKLRSPIRWYRISRRMNSAD